MANPGRVIDMGGEARKAWGEEWGKPEVAYDFSNGRKFDSPGDAGGPYAYTIGTTWDGGATVWDSQLGNPNTVWDFS